MYYPKSQITANLYTNGNEYIILSNGRDYTGYYFTTSDNRIFSGRNPNDKPNFELISSKSDNNVVLDAEIGIEASYSKTTNTRLLPFEYLRNTKINTSNPVPSLPIQISTLPTEKNYEIGEYQRYFLKRINSINYVEIDQDQYQKYINKEPNTLYRLYAPFKLPWIISGNRSKAYKINEDTIKRVSFNLNLIGFKSYFKEDYTQYFRYSEGENLTTDGTEFLNETTGKPYIGLYHVHPDKGPMVGAQHVETKHDYLIPISGSNTQYRINEMETQMSTQIRSGGSSGGY